MVIGEWILAKRRIKKMTKLEQQEQDAALEYCKTNELQSQSDAYFAFLAGVQWQKTRPPIKPEREYYGG